MDKLIIFIGMPGCGKGTQADLICEEFGYELLSVGQLLRSYIEDIDDEKKTDSTSQTIKSCIEKGLLIPDDITNKIVQDNIKSGKSYILDGYPRSLNQADFLDDVSTHKKIFIYLKVDEEVLLDRILARIQCKNCLKTYSSHNIDIENFSCDKCGYKSFSVRKDDNKKILEDRIKEFNNKTLPVIELYKKLDVLDVVNASEDIQIVNKNIKNIINKY